MACERILFLSTTGFRGGDYRNGIWLALWRSAKQIPLIEWPSYSQSLSRESALQGCRSQPCPASTVARNVSDQDPFRYSQDWPENPCRVRDGNPGTSLCPAEYLPSPRQTPTGHERPACGDWIHRCCQPDATGSIGHRMHQYPVQLFNDRRVIFLVRFNNLRSTHDTASCCIRSSGFIIQVNADRDFCHACTLAAFWPRGQSNRFSQSTDGSPTTVKSGFSRFSLRL